MESKVGVDAAPVDAVVSRDDALAAIKRAIDGSIPYIATHGAFLIPAASWNELAAMVYPMACPMVRRLDAAFARMDRGEKLTEAEIRDVLG